RREEIVFAIAEPRMESRWVAPENVQPSRAPEPWPQSFPSPNRAEAPRGFESPRFEILPETPGWRTTTPPTWTAAQAKALDELISFEIKRTQQGSIELEELIRRHLGRPEFPEEAAEELLGAPSSLELVALAEKALAQMPSSLEAI